MKNCFIGQSGGPTVAINASLAGIIFKCSGHYDHIYGMINGISGLLEDEYFDLKEVFNSKNKLDILTHSPAMYLGSCRYKLPDVSESEDIYKYLFKMFRDLGITDFFYIGGNDSMDTVKKLSNYAKYIGSNIHFIGIPKTIDNDLIGTDHTPGFGSAAKFVASSMVEIYYDASIYKLKSVTIVEIMGRNAGWLTAASALARENGVSAPDLIYLPEIPFDRQKFLNDIQEKFKEKSSVIIAVSEGIRYSDGQYLDQSSGYLRKDAFGHTIHSGTGKILEQMVRNVFHCKVRSIESNVLQRCAMHMASKTDIEESYELGKYATERALENDTGVMAAIKRISNSPYKVNYVTYDVDKVANVEHKVPLEWISHSKNDITKELHDYLYPLIQGEEEIHYRNGIPHFIDIEHLKMY